MPNRGRTIVEVDSYRQMKATLGAPELADEVQQSFDLVLANDPMYGEPVLGHSGLYVFRTIAYPPRVPAGFRVLYRFRSETDDQAIELLGIEELPSSPNSG